MLNVNAENFSDTLSPNYELPELINFIKERVVACGINADDIKNHPEMDQFGYSLQLSEKAKGNITLIYNFILNRIELSLYATENYDLETWTELTRSSGIKYFVPTSNLNPLTIYSVPINNQIFGLDFVESGNNYKGFLGIAYPIPDDWYDENIWMLAGLINPTMPNNFSIPVPNPANRAMTCRFKIDNFGDRNPDNFAQIIPAPYCTFDRYGIGGKFSDEIGLSNNKGFSTNDISIDGDNKYWNLYCGDNGVVIQVKS